MTVGHNEPTTTEWSVEDLVPILPAILRAIQFGLDPDRPNWQTTFLEHLNAQSENEGHPLTPWFALRWARDHRIPMPDWVIDYFYDRGRAIQRVIHAPPADHNEAEAVGRQLGFYAQGRGVKSPGAEADRQALHWQIAFEMAIAQRATEQRGEHFKKMGVRHEAAKRHDCSEATVRRAEQEFGEVAGRQVSVLVAYLGLSGNGDLLTP